MFMLKQVGVRGWKVSNCTPDLHSDTFAEFRRHKDVTNPVHIMGFLSQWKVYLDQLPRGSDGRDFAGKKLDPTLVEKVCLLADLITRWF